MVLFAAALVGALAPAGCGVLEPGDEALERLERARALWHAAGIRDYRIRLERRCFCPPESLGPALVSVRGSVYVTAVVYADDWEPMPEGYARWFPSVEGLFDIVEDALLRDAAVVDVTYDRDLGLPREIWIDYKASIADEEMGYVVGIPEPLD